MPETQRADAASLTLASAATRRHTEAATQTTARAHQTGSLVLTPSHSEDCVPASSAGGVNEEDEAEGTYS
ncbi:MAG: hypothetical protein AAF666_14580, partial [Pseudomonadota bacterium]